MKELSFDSNLFFEDIFFLQTLKFPKEDDTGLESFADAAARYAMRYATTRWLSMKYVAVITVKQKRE